MYSLNTVAAVSFSFQISAHLISRSNQPNWLIMITPVENNFPVVRKKGFLRRFALTSKRRFHQENEHTG